MSIADLPGGFVPPPLNPRDAAVGQAILSNPLEFPDGYQAWLEQFIRLRLPTEKALEAMVARIAHPVGFLLIVPDDLTANTSEYVYTHPLTGLKYLYCNGAAVSQTTYADLYALWGANKYLADSGGNFFLPDSRGRDLVFAGTHADVDVGDTFGPATEADRRGAKHGHPTSTASVTGAPSVGSLAISPNPHSHTITSSAVTLPVGRADIPAGSGINVGGSSDAGTTTTSLSVTGAPGVGTLDVGGTIGTDTNDGGSAIVIGSLVVRY